MALHRSILRIAVAAAIGFLCFIFQFKSAVAQTDFSYEELRVTKDGRPSVFKSTIFSGMRNDFRSFRANAGRADSIGPFIRPEIEFRFREPEEYFLSLRYRFTATGAQSWGGADTPSDFSDNAFFMHQPSLIASGKLARDLSIGLTSIFQIMNNSGDQRKNMFAMFFNPNLRYKLDEGISVFAGYLYDRTTNLDTTIGDTFDRMTSAEADLHASTASKAPSQKQNPSAKNQTDSKPATNSPIQSFDLSKQPVRTLNAGELGTSIRWTQTTASRISVLSGKNSTNLPIGGAYYNAVRMDVSSRFGQIKCKLLYQFNADVRSYKSGKIGFKHRTRFLAGYPLGSDWAANLETSFNADLSNGHGGGGGLSQTERPRYSNETYLGMTYSF